ncbi:MAG: hypothetical protein COA42_23070 [Alteromonadaceae bacterium]|nr:MAG: hypothetical protein COA42_23070 [Alteromonadaceae bacterium]
MTGNLIALIGVFLPLAFFCYQQSREYSTGVLQFFDDWRVCRIITIIYLAAFILIIFSVGASNISGDGRGSIGDLGDIIHYYIVPGFGFSFILFSEYAVELVPALSQDREKTAQLGAIIIGWLIVLYMTFSILVEWL